MADITLEDVEYVADLARLELSARGFEANTSGVLAGP